jgi:hypothetical protein
MAGPLNWPDLVAPVSNIVIEAWAS